MVLTRFNRMVLRMLPGPFFGWLTALMFLLVLQFLIKHMPDLVGKGLPIGAIVELIVLSLAYMLVLAVPMSVLIATLIVFGKLAENRAYAVIKSAGVSFLQLAWPAILLGACVSGAMIYFNTEVLPEANFRTKVLWSDIRQKKPGFLLQPGVFYDGIRRYSILVNDLDPVTNEMRDVTIFDYSDGTRRRAEIKARRGEIIPLKGGEQLRLILHDGEVHQLQDADETMKSRYERVRFGEHRMTVSLDNFQFERSDLSRGRRSDRTMRVGQMVAYVDSMRNLIDNQKIVLENSIESLGKPSESDRAGVLPGRAQRSGGGGSGLTSDRLAVFDLSPDMTQSVYYRAMQVAKLQRTGIENTNSTLSWQQQQADRYSVEIHKKYSIAVACLIFLLIAAPLGLSIRNSSLSMTGAIAMGIFMFYWVSLVYGEKLSDRGKLDPWVGMWIANALAIIGIIYLILYVSLDLRATPSLRKRFIHWRKTRNLTG